jgi:hypothetical protein
MLKLLDKELEIELFDSAQCRQLAAFSTETEFGSQEFTYIFACTKRVLWEKPQGTERQETIERAIGCDGFSFVPYGFELGLVEVHQTECFFCGEPFEN